MGLLFIRIGKSINLSLIHWDRRDRGTLLSIGAFTLAKMGLSIHSVTTSAPGKVILFGEHAVLYKAVRPSVTETPWLMTCSRP